MSESSTPMLQPGDLEWLRNERGWNDRAASIYRLGRYHPYLAVAERLDRAIRILETLPAHAARLRDLVDDLYVMSADLPLSTYMQARLRAIHAIADATEGR